MVTAVTWHLVHLPIGLGSVARTDPGCPDPGGPGSGDPDNGPGVSPPRIDDSPGGAPSSTVYGHSSEGAAGHLCRTVGRSPAHGGRCHCATCEVNQASMAFWRDPQTYGVIRWVLIDESGGSVATGWIPLTTG